MSYWTVILIDFSVTPQTDSNSYPCDGSLSAEIYQPHNQDEVDLVSCFQQLDSL